MLSVAHELPTCIGETEYTTARSMRALQLCIELDCALQNVVDGAITIAFYFVIGYAFASNSGNQFIGTEVRRCTPCCFCGLGW